MNHTQRSSGGDVGRWKKAGIIGATVGAAAAAVAAGVAAPRYLARRARSDKADPYAAEPFEFPPTDHVGIVTTRDGVDLNVEAIGDEDAPLTVIFAHGYCMESGVFYFQRKALNEVLHPSKHHGPGTNGSRGNGHSPDAASRRNLIAYLHEHPNAGFRAVFYDQPGHGRSGALPDTEYSIDDLAAALEDVIEAVAPEGKLMIVGHSMGGMSVFALARRRPDLFKKRVAALCLISASAGGINELNFGMPRVLKRVRRTALPMVQRVTGWTPQLIDRARHLAGDIAWLITRKYGFANDDPSPALVSEVERMNTHTPMPTVMGYVRAILDHDETAVLGTMRTWKIPTLIIVGDDDQFTPTEHARFIAESLPHATHVVLAQAAHVPQMEHPGEISQRLLEIINKTVASTPPLKRGRTRKSTHRLWTPFKNPKKEF
ncbi:alpha/beta fold hydrolase [Natronoglycomyces albus]|uniref:Alpha/beta hydrolase n=1 Tax=Natronoglycomyces albus TaxID=2811108 RepID=A0A895XRI5_9ACTN|nr:alpha/beta hydrolase [Natronoglycomyces albus]QSB05795.1 alpha/beta hydrolase [Natronoglycomyces albus]